MTRAGTPGSRSRNSPGGKRRPRLHRSPRAAPGLPPAAEERPGTGHPLPGRRLPPHRHTSERPAYENADNPGNSGLADGLTGFLRHMLDQFHLDSVDTGDLLLLGLLFFLFREDADEELLVALGLLLIL